ncbi:hypothetical protein L7F22_060636 [Adiantum nelumboides]|nr:hypothetical protein [Adiantum nelumboides]
MKIFLVLFIAVLATQVKADDQRERDVIRQVTEPPEEVSRGIGIPIRTPLQASPRALFERFKGLFNKTYASTEEHAHRFRVFKKNLAKAVQAQLMDPSATHGITIFSDLTEEEFSEHYLGLKQPLAFPSSDNLAPILPTNDLPTDFDWHQLGAVSEVRNQGLCGSCWSFSTTGAVEGAYFVATGKLLSLSEQQLVDCDHECDPSYGANACDNGCFGGLMTSAFSYIQKAGGLQLEEDYPYKGFKGQCKFDASKVAVKVANFSSVMVDEEQIAANLVANGPLAIGINALFMQTYIGGVSCPYVCGKNLDHGVLLVGYGESAFSPARLKAKSYWIIKNSWGPHWGEKGFYKICRGYNECGMDTMVSTVSAAIVE